MHTRKDNFTYFVSWKQQKHDKCYQIEKAKMLQMTLLRNVMCSFVGVIFATVG